MTTVTAAASKRQRFDVELKLSITSRQRDELDALAQRTDSTRAHEVRQAIARHLRYKASPVGGLSLAEAREAREYLADIEARLEVTGLHAGDGSSTPGGACTSLSTGLSA